MGSRKYEKATTLPSNTSQTIDKPYQYITKSNLGNTIQPASSATSSVVGGSFWGRTTGVGRGHSPSSFQDFDDSVSDAWDSKDDKGMGYAGSSVTGSVIDVQPMSVSPFNIAKVNSQGPGVHGKYSAKSNTHATTAKNISTPIPPEVTTAPTERHYTPSSKSVDQESEPVPVSSNNSNGSTLPKTLENLGEKTSPTHTTSNVTSSISASPSSTTISFGSNLNSGGAGTGGYLKENQGNLSGENKRFAKLETLINDSLSFELEELRKLAWSGISSKARAKAWKILCGYLPPPGTASIRFVFIIRNI